MEREEQFSLQTGIEVDHHVAATDEVHARERGVYDQVLLGENDALAQVLDDAVAIFLLDKKLSQALGRDILGERLGVEALAGFFEEFLVEVGREDL